MGTSSSSSSSRSGTSSVHSSRLKRWRVALQHWATDVSWGQELSGSLGDLGTFLPLVVALSASIQLDLGTTLLFSGLYNVASGVGFKIPMCVQPMKTIAAVALSAGPPGGLSLPEVMCAGVFVGGVMLLLGLTGTMDLASRAVPGSIVRGIQLAVGLQLAQKGVAQVFKGDARGYRVLWGVEGLLLGLCSTAFLLITTLPHTLADNTPQQQEQQQQQQQQQASQGQCIGDSHERKGLLHLAAADDASSDLQDDQQPQQTQAPPQRQQQQAQPDAAAAADNSSGSCSSSSSSSGVPSALILVLIGLLLTIISSPRVLSELRLGPSKPQLYLPTWQVFKAGVLKAGLAQLPLTSLNSVIAVSHLAVQLFPDRLAAQGWRWRPCAVAVSVGLMNLMGCWFGAFPCCHGSGGLAAQYKFGARTGVAPVLLGGMKVLLAVLFGSSLLQLLQHFPQPLLGSLLLLSGLELAASARKETTQRGYCFMLLTAAAILGLRNTAVGFGVGLGGCVVVGVHGWVAGRVGCWWQQRAGVTKGEAVRGHCFSCPV